MSRETAVSAIVAGLCMAGELKEKGYRLIATGEMGIGNTTTSSAVAAMLLGRDPAEMTGRGAGLSDEGLRKKVSVIREAVKRYEAQCRDAIDVIACVGGLDLAGLTGVFLGGAVYRIDFRGTRIKTVCSGRDVPGRGNGGGSIDPASRHGAGGLYENEHISGYPD